MANVPAARFQFSQITTLADAQRNFEQLQSLFAGLGKRVRVYHSVDQAIPDDSEVFLSFDSEEYDTELDVDSMHNETASSRLTIKTPGVYNVWANVGFSGEDGGQRSVQIRLNGSTNIATANRFPIGAPTDDWLEASASWYFFEGDYVEVVVYQTNDAHVDVNVIASPSTSPEFGLTWSSP